jgi:hypothetical protein
MSAVIDVFWQVITPIMLVASLGYVLARRVNLSGRSLAHLTFYLLSPCLLYDKISHTSLSATDLQQLAAFAVLTMAGSAALGWLLARLLRLSRAQIAAFMIVAFAGNTGNYGLAASQFAFGPAALEPAVIYYAVSTLMISTVGVYLAASGRRSATMALRNALRVPLTYAGIAGVLVWATGIHPPLPIQRTVNLLGQGAIPVMLVLLGVQLAETHLRADGMRITLAAATKLVGGALIGIAVAGLLELTGLARQTSILQASMPTAVMAAVLARQYDAETGFTTGAIFASTLGSLITVTLVLTYLR